MLIAPGGAFRPAEAELMGAEVDRTPHASTCTEFDAEHPACVYVQRTIGL
jgi:hypothetical protein